jgi:sialic acid synthase SpsE
MRQQSGVDDVSLLKCTSPYPAPADSMDITKIPQMANLFDLPAGLPDHSEGIGAAVSVVVQGASIIEKYLTLSRDEKVLNLALSLERDDFERMVESIGQAEHSLGEVA